MRLRSSRSFAIEDLPFPQHPAEAFGLPHAEIGEPRLQTAADDLSQPRLAVGAAREEQIAVVGAVGDWSGGQPAVDLIDLSCDTRRVAPASAIHAPRPTAGTRARAGRNPDRSLANRTSGRPRLLPPQPRTGPSGRRPARRVIALLFMTDLRLQRRQEGDQRLLVRGRQRLPNVCPSFSTSTVLLLYICWMNGRCSRPICDTPLRTLDQAGGQLLQDVLQRRDDPVDFRRPRDWYFSRSPATSVFTRTRSPTSSL